MERGVEVLDKTLARLSNISAGVTDAVRAVGETGCAVLLVRDISMCGDVHCK